VWESVSQAYLEKGVEVKKEKNRGGKGGFVLARAEAF